MALKGANKFENQYYHSDGDQSRSAIGQGIAWPNLGSIGVTVPLVVICAVADLSLHSDLIIVQLFNQLPS